MVDGVNRIKTLRQLKDELLPALASPSYGLDATATIWVDLQRDCLCVGDQHDGVAFVITRREIEDGSYKRRFNPQLLAWKAARAR